jgi:hypothetical protein
VIYQAILRADKEATEAGYRPNGVRMGKEAFELLKAEIGPGLASVRTSYGEKITTLETPLSRLRLIHDKHLGDGWILTVAIPPLWREPMRVFEEDGEYHAE